MLQENILGWKDDHPILISDVPKSIVDQAMASTWHNAKPQRNVEIVFDRQNNLTMSEIAKKHGISTNRVLQVLYQAGWKIRRTDWYKQFVPK